MFVLEGKLTAGRYNSEYSISSVGNVVAENQLMMFDWDISDYHF